MTKQNRFSGRTTLPARKNCTHCQQEINAHFNSHTLANALIKLLPDYVKLQQLINETLHLQLPKNFCKKAHRIAIDLVLIPYHGEHQYRLDEVYRSQPKASTSHFHAYATACIVHKGHRYTVALIPVAKRTPMKEVIQALLLPRQFNLSSRIDT